MLALTNGNWLAIVVAAVINMLIGFLWYGPLFGQTWLRWIDKEPEEIEPDNSMYAISVLAAFISAYVLAVIIRTVGVTGWVSGALTGALVWIGIGATGTLVYTTFEGPPRSVWSLHAAYQLVVFLIQGALFAVWV